MARHLFSVWSGPPADAQQYKSLRWVFKSSEAANGSRVWLQMWSGRAKVPFVNNIYRDMAAAERAIESAKQSEDRHEAFKAEQAADRKRRTAEMVRQIKVGTILHDSWGYEQTQCDYYQVVERRGSIAVIRPIASASVPGSEGFMSDRRCPVPDKFVGEPIRKRIGPYGISTEHGCATIVHPWEQHYCSWYH